MGSIYAVIKCRWPTSEITWSSRACSLCTQSGAFVCPHSYASCEMSRFRRVRRTVLRTPGARRGPIRQKKVTSVAHMNAAHSASLVSCIGTEIVSIGVIGNLLSRGIVYRTVCLGSGRG